VSLRSSSGFVGWRRPDSLFIFSSSSPLLRLPPPRRAARRLLDEAPSADSKRAASGSSTGVPLFLPSFFPLLPPFSGGSDLEGGGESPWVARYREVDGWGLYKAASLGFGL
jgi:hypothetical protein